MFLRVHSIADLTLTGGNHIDFSFLSLDPSLTTEHSHREILEMLQTSTKPPIIATDGSVKP
jgi:hypothetical protein